MVTNLRRAVLASYARRRGNWEALRPLQYEKPAVLRSLFDDRTMKRRINTTLRPPENSWPPAACFGSPQPGLTGFGAPGKKCEAMAKRCRVFLPASEEMLADFMVIQRNRLFPERRYWCCGRRHGAFAADAPKNSECMECHSDNTLTKKDTAGKEISLFVDAASSRLRCTRPTPAPVATRTSPPNTRITSCQAQRVKCANCHAEQSESYGASVHGLARQRPHSGPRRAATATVA